MGEEGGGEGGKGGGGEGGRGGKGGGGEERQIDVQVNSGTNVHTCTWTCAGYALINAPLLSPGL